MIRTFPGAVTAFAAEVGADDPVAVEGRRTRWARGGPLDPRARLVRAPAGLLAHAPADMTVRVLAGTEVRELHEELARAGQRTALPERGGTVGGALAVGDDDLCAPGVGTVRAALLECTSVTADGRLVTGGGPTVKNVSGYDLPRLMVGALGTLGPLVSVLVRTVPVPAASGWWRSDDADVDVLRSALYRPAALCTDGATTWVRLEGHAVDVHAQAQVLARLGTFEETDAGPTPPDWRWSLPRAAVRGWIEEGTRDGLACLLTGRLWRTEPQPRAALDPAIVGLHERLRTLFDPTGRFNPGRDVTRE